MKYLLCCFLFIVLIKNPVSAQVKSPDEFLGYSLGSHFTPHHKVVDYFKYIGGANKNVKLLKYGKTYEGRELMVAIVSSKENLENLEQIRKANLSMSLAEKSSSKAKQPVILWLSYNVHGNEASSTETALKMLYTLTEGKAPNVQSWLKNTVVIIDPCLNPDGRERYVNFFTSVSGSQPNVDPVSREHVEPWPGGRSNHYYFDLNRDWAWQSQLETEQRLALYHDWMPEVHVDFHEQNYNEPYYFAPAAEPIHQDVTAWQREFQVIVGKNNAKYFDQNGWKYFTKEQFDLLYPSYGDTYPLYNGAVGMTYEQGGIGAGLAVVTLDGDTLTLKDRIEHHFTSGMATLESVSNHAGQLVDEFRRYFEKSMNTPPGFYKTYVVKAQNTGRLKKMIELLKKNRIDFSFGSDRSPNGYNYETRKTEGFKIERNDLVVNLQQPRSVLANVLFEPQTSVSDSNTYDITAWALPYAFGLKTYATTESFKGKYAFMEEPKIVAEPALKPYAWIFSWNSLEDAQILIALQKENIKVRIAEERFTIGGKVFPVGTLLVFRAENERISKDVALKVAAIERKLKMSFYTANSGFVDKGKDFGSSVYHALSIPKVAMIAGNESSAQAVGEIWHFFEQEIKYPISIISTRTLDAFDLSRINVLIFPDGIYNEDIASKLEGWVSSGGKVILLEDAISAVSDTKPFTVKKKEPINPETYNTESYANRKQGNLSDVIPGAVFKVYLDSSHPLSTGLGDYYYALKTDDKLYEPLVRGWNVGVLKSDSYLSGVVGKNVLRKLDGGMLFGVQSIGKGTAVYLGTDILFRSFWESGKQLFVNALFLVD